MDKSLKFIAFDLGASSGRGMLGSFNGSRLKIEELHRFANEPVSLRGSLYWDILKIFSEIKKGLNKCSISGVKNIASLSVDTWGVDFGLIDRDGKLIENPYSYRDSRTNGMMDEVFKIIPEEELYSKTGVQLMEINTVFQLFSMAHNNSYRIKEADSLLLMPDLINYFLTGIKAAERTMASTTQLLKPDGSGWLYDIIDKLDIPQNIFPEIVPSISVIGSISDDIACETGAAKLPVVASASHDTQCAVSAIPSLLDDYIYLSCGTWSLIGAEIQKPCINKKSMELKFTNEIGADGRITFHRNVIGLWIIQECKKYWERNGESISFGDMVEYARTAKPFESFIDPNNPVFMSPGNMPDKIKKYCAYTGQKVPDNKGSIVRCVLQSMALEYRASVNAIEDILNRKFNKIHIVGGGCNNKLLCQLTADATGKCVAAGPAEATAIGNIMLQAICMGEVKDLKQAREIIGCSYPVEIYEPREKGPWDEAYRRMVPILLYGEGSI